MTASGVQRIRITVPATDVMPDTRRGVGCRAVCGDHWRGPSRKTYMEARKDLRMHRLEAHP